MNPLDLIKQDLGPHERCGIDVCDEWPRFGDYEIYVVSGQTNQFDFPSLPRGSYGYYAVNGTEAVRLRRAGKEIERVLAADWPSLPAMDPVTLADFVLTFCGGGIEAGHRVLADADELVARYARPGAYRINERALAQARPGIGTTSCTMANETVELRAVTLCGWMHNKQNLGVERMAIARDGSVALAPRVVLATRIFDEVPRTMY